MEIKQQGERIKRNYQVISVFPFVDGVLYYTTYDSFDPEETPTRFIHAIQLHPLPDENTLSKLPLRNERIFVPLQEVFVEDGVLYQVFEKMEGNLLGIYLYQNAPLALGEISQITQTISDHLMECESQDEFALIDPQNMVIEENTKIRFLYGGPLSVFPREKANSYSEAEIAKQMAELLFHMLTGDGFEEHKDEMRPLRSLRGDVPVELESWIMKSVSPDPIMRPPLHELWKWAHSFGGKKPEMIEDVEPEPEPKKKEKSLMEKLIPNKQPLSDKLNSNKPPLSDKLLPHKPKLDSFGVKDIKAKSNDKKQKKKLPAWVTWVVIGVLALLFLMQLWASPDPDVTALIDAKIIQEVEQDENKAISLYNQSVKAYEGKDIEKSLALAKQALAVDTGNKTYYVHLANLYGLKKDYKSGVLVLTSATSYITDDAKLFDQLAVFHFYVRDYEKAKEAIEQAVGINKNMASAQYHRGKIYNALKNSDEAIASMKIAVAKDPKNALYFHDFALIQLQANHIQAAVDNEKKAVQLDKKNIDYLISLGLLYLKQRDELLRNQSLRPEIKEKRLKDLLNLAFDQFVEVNKIDDKNAEGYYYKARAYYINGKSNADSYQSAIIATQKALTRDPDNALYAYQLGVCYMAVKNKAQAVAAFQKATTLEPSNRLYQNGLSSAQAMK
ncbi:tetratricopeptide repeat protein [Shimazuella alba]|uniref:Tetratricopeptide repeat protein n=1 Tax=Shimazuella alba TaxID=2690964 RepID=A0A6I4VS49_9BACL|nr:tetratricopeptide repeat protein [Shimazuella alba]MXQ54559.1 tetratricopeptide repeat protein [Shimazuella alba]